MLLIGSAWTYWDTRAGLVNIGGIFNGFRQRYWANYRRLREWCIKFWGLITEGMWSWRFDWKGAYFGKMSENWSVFETKGNCSSVQKIKRWTKSIDWIHYMQRAELSGLWSQMLHLVQVLANGPRTVMLHLCTVAPEAQCHGLKTGFIPKSDQPVMTGDNKTKPMSEGFIYIYGPIAILRSHIGHGMSNT